jgi:hypothetical protein
MNSTQTSSVLNATSDNLTACVTVVPGRHGHVPIDACNSYYNFEPSYGAAIFFTVAFATLTAVHIMQAGIHKKVHDRIATKSNK